jgi:mannose-1-phosphate guanylyltransferase
MNPTGQDHDYGWILPSAPGAVAGVRQFVEKPPADAVRGLLGRGALINSFVIAGRVQALLSMFHRTLPELTATFRSHVRPPLGVCGLTSLYQRIADTDLSRQVLQPLPDHLAVIRVPPCGWSDLGTPARLRSYLSQIAVAA